MSEMTPKSGAMLASIMIGCIGSLAAKAETTISWVAAKAPRELLACTSVSIPNDTRDEAQRVLGERTEIMVQAAIKSKISKIGEPFVFRITSGQLKDAYPLSLDFCMPIEKKPSRSDIDFQYVDVPERAARLGYCPSSSPDDCQAAVDTAVAPAPVVVNSVKEETKDAPAKDTSAAKDTSTAPSTSDAETSTTSSFLGLNELGVRSGSWNSDKPPADVAAMQAVVYRMWPPAEAPFGGGVATKAEDSPPAARELGKIPNIPAAGAAPARIDAPDKPFIFGFVFSIPPRLDSK